MPPAPNPSFVAFRLVAKGQCAVRQRCVDLLVEFSREAKPSFFDLAEIEHELSALLAGRRVDLRTAEDLSRYFRDEVLREAEVQYESS